MAKRLSKSSLVLTFLQAHLGEFVPYQRLRDVGEMDDVPRLLRQFRADGWPIEMPGDATARLLPKERGPSRYLAGDFTAVQREAIFRRDGYCCQGCGVQAGALNGWGAVATLQAHHVVERANGGASAVENGLTLCMVCHQARHALKVEN